jgi:hypothetical protein
MAPPFGGGREGSITGVELVDGSKISKKLTFELACGLSEARKSVSSWFSCCIAWK